MAVWHGVKGMEGATQPNHGLDKFVLDPRSNTLTPRGGLAASQVSDAGPGVSVIVAPRVPKR